MKKSFKRFWQILKWTLRIAVLGLIVFLIVKYVQAKFYYKPEPTERLAFKQQYLSDIEAGPLDTVVEIPVPMSLRVLPDSNNGLDSTVQNFLQTQTIQQKRRRLPNIILIVLDDLGYGDLGVYGNEAVYTPNMDSLAKQGMRLTQFYVPSAYGTPARAAFLSGRYPIRSGMTHILYPSSSRNTTLQKAQNYQLGIKEDEILLAEPLKEAGYATGLIGKWHLGDQAPHLPSNFGFDEFFGVLVSHDQAPMHLYNNTEIAQEHPVPIEKLVKSFTRESKRFIQEHRDEAFFLYLAHCFPRMPLYQPDAVLGKSPAGNYGDVLEELDQGIGELMATLEKEGLDGETMVILTSDNGPSFQGSAGGLRGRKYEVFEGGVRVPFIVRWPGAIPKGTVNETPAMAIDLFPSLLAMTGVPLPDDRIIDGKNIWPMLNGRKTEPLDRSLYFFWQDEVLAMREGNLKYHMPHRIAWYNVDYPLPQEVMQGPWLFDLTHDAEEAFDLSSRRKNLSGEFQAEIEAFAAQLKDNPRGWKDP